MEDLDLTPFHALAELAAEAPRTMGRDLTRIAGMIADAALSGRTLFTFGNGGSASEALHFAAEFVVRYKDDRRPLAAVALTADVATITACANDYDYGSIFARQIEALGRKGDVAVGLSTSGKSPNVLFALEKARQRGLAAVLFTGEKGRAEAAKWDAALVVPSLETAHVQEIHLAAIHVICRHIDAEIAKRG